MKITLLIIFGFVPLCNATAQCADYYKDIDTAEMLYDEGKFQQSSEAYAKAFVCKEYITGTDLYNGACSAALAGDKNTAFGWLFKYIETDSEFYMENCKSDEDFKNLYSDARWKVFTDTMTVRKKRIERNYDKSLRKKLLKILDEDQKYRYQVIAAQKDTVHYNEEDINALWNKINAIDSINQIKICKMLDNQGFMGRNKVGDACRTYWLVIQHAPCELQKKYLPMFQKAAENKDLKPHLIAMIEDRIELYEKRPQKYGTQRVNGKLWTLLDPEKVNQWRQEVGLKPLADNLIDNMIPQE